MPDIRRNLIEGSEGLCRVAADAGYVMVGLGVVGVQKAEAARRQLSDELRKGQSATSGPAADARDRLARAARELDAAAGQLFAAADAAVEPAAEKLPDGAKRLLRRAQEGRDTLRHWVREQLAA